MKIVREQIGQNKHIWHVFYFLVLYKVFNPLDTAFVRTWYNLQITIFKTLLLRENIRMLKFFCSLFFRIRNEYGN